MKDCTPPVTTPFAISNALNTPNRIGDNDYFPLSRTLGSAKHELGTVERDGQYTAEALLQKLHTLEEPPARSLIDSIPNELLALIFEFGYFEGEGQYPDTEFRSLMLQTSLRFRQLTLHTPSLWSIIYLSQSNVADEVDNLAFYLECSAQYPLDIRLSCFWSEDLTDAIMQKLLPHSRRWRRLAVVAINPYIFTYLENTSVPILDNLELSFFSHERRMNAPSSIFNGEVPRLAHLCLRNIDLDTLNFSLRGLRTLEIRGYGTWPTLSRFTEMLAGASTLERFILHVKPGQVTQQLFSDGHRSQTHIVLPALRTFEVYSSEWLSPAIVSLIHVFVCPNLESFVLREGVGSASDTSGTIASYTRTAHQHKDVRLYDPSHTGMRDTLFTGFPHRLYAQSANVALACKVTMTPSATLTSLELRRPFFPFIDVTKAALSALKNLKHLFFLDMLPNAAMMQLLDQNEEILGEEIDAVRGTIHIPSLETLVLEINCEKNRAEFATSQVDFVEDLNAEFLEVFSLPSLRSLVFKNLEAKSWTKISRSFARRAGECTQLASLKLINMTDVLPVEPTHWMYQDNAQSFPHLRRLLLDSVGSNAFIHQILPTRPAPAPSNDTAEDDSLSPWVPWPGLEELSVCGDANASKPLLHRVVAAREKIGRPLKVLYLDDHFATNEDSWNWLNERVQVRKAEPGFL